MLLTDPECWLDGRLMEGLLANRRVTEACADEAIGAPDGVLTDRPLVGRGDRRLMGVLVVATGRRVGVLGDKSRKQDLFPTILGAPGLLKLLRGLAWGADGAVQRSSAKRMLGS
jgi:hypothetical protein